MHRWAEEEIKILKYGYLIKDKEVLCKDLPDRTWEAIKTKAEELKLSFGRYGLTSEQRFWCLVDRKLDNDCWNWTGCCKSDGYGKISINKKSIIAHRYSWNIHFGRIPKDKPCVLHHCDNPKCVNPKHLFLGTMKDNSDDMIIKKRDRKASGENHYQSKLTWDQVRQIRDLKSKFLQIEIAKMFNVSKSLISYIHNNKIWREK